MKHYNKINSAINFIEKNLTENIGVKDVSDNVFSSLWHFQRIFRCMTGHSIYSYIRKRRLSEAANELILTNAKIIDIALKFQYETPETFLREFKKTYGSTPSEYRKTSEHPVFEKIDIYEDRYKNVYDRNGIEFRPVTRGKIGFVGQKHRTTMQKNQSAMDIPEIWRGSFQNQIFSQIPNPLNPKITLGVYTNWDYEENFDFLVGTEVGDETVPPPDFVKYTLPPAKYMLFTIPGNSSEKLIYAWKYIYGTWLPNSGYDRGDRDDFEVFDDRFQDPVNPLSDIYLSIR